MDWTNLRMLLAGAVNEDWPPIIGRSGDNWIVLQNNRTKLVPVDGARVIIDTDGGYVFAACHHGVVDESPSWIKDNWDAKYDDED